MRFVAAREVYLMRRRLAACIAYFLRGLARAPLSTDGRDGSPLLVPQPPNKLLDFLVMPREVRNRVRQLRRERFG